MASESSSAVLELNDADTTDTEAPSVTDDAHDGTPLIMEHGYDIAVKEVFIHARKHFGINNSWTADGSIIVFLPDKSRKKITLMSELHALTEKYPLAQSVQDQKSARTRRNRNPAKS